MIQSLQLVACLLVGCLLNEGVTESLLQAGDDLSDALVMYAPPGTE